MTMMRISLRPAVVVAAGVLVLAGCGSAIPSAGKSVVQADPAAVVAAAANADCVDGKSPVASLDPGTITTNPSSWRDTSTMAKVRKSGRLEVATSGDVRLWGARNPENGHLEGFDIDVLKRIAAAIGPDVKLDYKVVNYAGRLPALNDGSVQLVADQMTINCDRWFGGSSTNNQFINFSTAYYQAGQKILVRRDSKVEDVDGLTDDDKVCVTASSTNVANIEKKVAADQVVQVNDLGECLVKFQEGEVTAITGDDTVLAGFSAQDPYAKVVGTAFTEEPYGLGTAPNDVDFTRFVNYVLQDMRKDGTLAALTNKYMKGTGVLPAVPKAVYGRDLEKRE